MHRFIFLATFLSAVFLVDLLASSAWLPQEPVPGPIQRAAEFSLVTAVLTSKPPMITREERRPLTCVDTLLSFVLDDLRRKEHETDKRGRNLVDSQIDKANVTECTELFDPPQPVDLNGDGKKEFIIRTAHHPEIGFYRGRSVNYQTWIIGADRRGFRKLLDAGVVSDVEIKAKKRGNYADLITTNPSTGAADTIAHYVYRNGGYRIARCMDETRLGNNKTRTTALDLADCG
jgi:hypothetical protein